MEKRFKVVRVDQKGTSEDPMVEEREELDKIGAELVGIDCETEDDVIKAVRDADAITTVKLQITRRVIETLTECRVIVRYGVGFDNIDIEAATEKGIVVVNLPHYCTEEVANHTMAFLLGCARKMVYLDAAMKRQIWPKPSQGRWVRSALGDMGSIYGQTLGIIGCGNIGRATARKARCFDLKLLGVDPYVDKKLTDQAGITLVTLPELLKESDYVTLHVPLTRETRHIMSDNEFGQMKPNAYLINTSRGPVVDEPALIKALHEKKIAGAALDVFEKEPIDPSNPLIKMPNVILTPHSANYSDASVTRQQRNVGQEAARVLSGRWPENTVNPSVKPRFKLE